MNRAVLTAVALAAACKPLGAPVAVAKGPASAVPAGVPLVIDGSGSTDPNGLPLTYRWSLAAAPGGSVARIAGTDRAAPSFTPDVLGEYQLALIVGDGRLVSLPSTVALTAACGVAAPQPAISLDATTPLVIGRAVRLSATVDDPDSLAPCSLARSVQLAWTFAALPAGSHAKLTAADGPTPQFVPDVSGDYVLHVEARAGALRGSAEKTVTLGACGADAPTLSAAVAIPAAPNVRQPTVLGVTAVDPDAACAGATPLAYAWRAVKLPSGSAARPDRPGEASPQVVPDLPGDYAYEVTVSARGRSSTATVAFSTTTCGGNIPVATPVVVSPAAPSVGDTVLLDATVTNPDAACIAAPNVSLAWTLEASPAGSVARLSDAASDTPSFSADVAGSYLVSVIATDSRGARSEPAHLTVTVGACGATGGLATLVPPAVSFDASQLAPANVGRAVSIAPTLVKVSDSNDACGRGAPYQYVWTFAALPAASAARLAQAAGLTPSFVPDVAGEYDLRVTVTDAAGLSGSAILPVTVSTCGSAPALVTVTAPATGATGSIGSPVQLAASGGSADLACGIALDFTYRWSVVSLPAGSKSTVAQPGAAVTSFTPDLAGTYTFSVVAIDSRGRISASQPATVNVLSCGTAAPTVTVVAAPTSATQGRPVGLTATITANDAASCGTLTHTYALAWSFAALPAGSRATLAPGYAATSFVPDIAQGTWLVQATVTDEHGNRASGSAAVTVNASTCVFTAGIDSTQVSAGPTGTPVALLGTPAAVCAPAHSVSYAWTFDQLPAGSRAAIVNAGAQFASFTPDLPGTYVAILRALDDAGRLAVSAPVPFVAGLCGTLAPTLTVAALDKTGAAVTSLPVGVALQLSASAADGNAACAPSGSIPPPVSVRWSIASAPAGSNAQPRDPTAPVTSFTADVAGSYVLAATATDAGGRATTKRVSFTATLDPCLAPPLAQIVAPAPVAAGQVVTLTAAAQTGACAAASYSWTLTPPPGSRSRIGGTAATATFVGDLDGTYYAQVAVTNTEGLSAVSASTAIVVGAGCVSPPGNVTISAVQPGLVAGFAGFALGQPVRLAASFAATACQPATVSWRLASAPAGSAALLQSSGANALFTPDVTGPYVVQAAVTDAAGLRAIAATTVSVASACGLTPPTVKLTRTPAVASQIVLGAPVGYTAAVTDANASCLAETFRYGWSFTAVPAAYQPPPNFSAGSTASFTPTIAGTYAVHLDVFDTTGLVASASDAFTTGLCGGQPPVARIAIDVSGAQADAPAQVPANGYTGVTTYRAFGASQVQIDAGPSFDLDIAGTVDPATGAATTCTVPEILTYWWDLLSSPAGSALTGNNAFNLRTSSNPTLQPDVSGTYVVRVTVSDGARSSQAEARIAIVVPFINRNLDSGGEYSSIALDASGNPRIAYLSTNCAGSTRCLRVDVCKAGCSGPRGGQTWASAQVPNSVASSDYGWYAQTFFDSSGNQLAAWYDNYNCAGRYATCAAGADCSVSANWSPVQTTLASPPTGFAAGNCDATAFAGKYLALRFYKNAAHVDPLPILAFQQQDSTGKKSIVVRSCHSDLSSCLTTAANQTTSTVTDAAIDIGYSLSMTTDASGEWQLSYYDRGNQRLKFAACGGSSCNPGTPNPPSPAGVTVDVASGHDLGQGSSLQPDFADTQVGGSFAGAPQSVIAYDDFTLASSGGVQYATHGRLRIIRCTSGCNSTVGGAVPTFSTPVVISAANNFELQFPNSTGQYFEAQGFTPSLFVDPSGNANTLVQLGVGNYPVLLPPNGTQPADTALVFATINQAGSVISQAVLDLNQNPTGLYPSLALDAAGDVFASYYSSGSNDLNYAFLP